MFVSKHSDEVIFSQYAFVVYPLVTQALGASAVISPANNFGHDLDAMLSLISEQTKLVFIANPNNPTGTLLGDNEVYSFLKQIPNNIPVVLDQAYFEYLNVDDNAIKWINEFENLIITRTFSKAYGLAGLRIGYGFSHETLINNLLKVKVPFEPSYFAQVAGCAALDDNKFMGETIKLNINIHWTIRTNIFF